MKVFLVYDEEGSITSGALVPPELDGQMELLPGFGESVIETTVREIGVEEDLDVDESGLVSERSMRAVRDAAMSCRVEVGERKLVKRSSPT